jgi:bifunctional UDP-N-acetylglucosamine pyrophosphorylase/glucosamine-1-phosphate N-acetyltransferase
METAIIILAAGLGKRMDSDLPKVLHEVAGAPMIMHLLRAVKTLEPRKIVTVTGHGAAEIEHRIAKFDPEIRFTRQKVQKGTGHAVNCAKDDLKGFKGNTLIVYGDVPFISTETFEKIIRKKNTNADLVVLSFYSENPANYGRLVVDNDDLVSIVEAKDASNEELNIRLCNSGVMCIDNGLLFDLLSELNNENANEEYYLTDIVGFARSQKCTVKYMICEDVETLGINTRAELSEAERLFQERARIKAVKNGVTLVQPETIYFSFDTEIGRDVYIGPNVVFGPGVTIESGAKILPFCHLEGCHISQGSQVGPFARLRPGTELNANVKVGNFVEIKNSIVNQNSKVNHLSYIGDASIGQHSNIGAGTVTCNYDGVNKYHTRIGDQVFLGSNTLLVAPVTVGDQSMTATGTIVTKDIPEGDLAIGRTIQKNKTGYAKKLMRLLKSKKKQKNT